MYSLKLDTDTGDLVIKGDNLDTVSGGSMLVQELRNWMLEPLGSNEVEPLFGSNLADYIGHIQQDPSEEVYRILNNFVSYWTNKVETDTLNGEGYKYSPDDILTGVDSVVIGQVSDAWTINVTFHTQSGQKEVTI